MPVNVKLLKKVRKMIVEEPRRLYMPLWGAKVATLKFHSIADPPPCGTVACLAGHIILASKPKNQWWRLFKKTGDLSSNEFNVPETAAKLIGIESHECPFHEHHWKAPEVLAWIDRQIDAASK